MDTVRCLDRKITAKITSAHGRAWETGMKAIGVLVAMLVGFAVLSLGVYKYDSSHTEDKVLEAEKAMQSDIDASLPRGASSADVDKLMDAHGIKAHTYMNFHRPIVGLDVGTGLDAGVQGAVRQHDARVLDRMDFLLRRIGPVFELQRQRAM